MLMDKIKDLIGINQDANTHDKKVVQRALEKQQKRLNKDDIADLMGLSYQRFSSLLPYRYYDKEDNLFINDQSIGFALELAPLTGANQDITKALSEMIKNKLSPEWVTQVMLVGSNRIEHHIDYLTRKTGDEVFDELRLNQYQFLNYAAHRGFPNKRNIDSPCRDYRLFVFISKKVSYNEHEAALCTELRSDIMMELKNAMISSAMLETKSLIILLKSLINQNQKTSYPSIKIDRYRELNEQIIEKDWSLRVNDNHCEVSLNSDGKSVENSYYFIELKATANRGSARIYG